MIPQPKIAPASLAAVVLYARRDAAEAAVQLLLEEEGFYVTKVPPEATYRRLGCAEAGWCAAASPEEAASLCAVVTHTLCLYRVEKAGTAQPESLPFETAVRRMSPRLYPQARLLVVAGTPERIGTVLKRLPRTNISDMDLFEL